MSVSLATALAIGICHRLDRMSGPARKGWIAEQRADFESMAARPDRAAAKLTLSAKALDRGGRGLTDALQKTGAHHDSGLVMNLAFNPI